MKILLFLILLCLSLKVPAQSNAQLGGCSGSVLRMPGMSGTDRALVLTNGHCLPLEFPSRQKSSVAKQVTDKKIYQDIFLYKSDLDLGARFSARRILYAAMLPRDLALIETEQSFDELSRLGYKTYALSPTPPKRGDVLSFHSLYMQRESLCEIEKAIPLLREEIFATKEVLRLKSAPGCQLDHGNSGTTGIKGDLIYALAFTRYDGSGPDCSLNNPCEGTQAQGKTAKVGQAYVYATDFLFVCYNEGLKKFDFAQPPCREALATLAPQP